MVQFPGSTIDISETIAFHREQEVVDRNFEMTNQFLSGLPGSFEKDKSRLVWHDVLAEAVVSGFLSRIRVHHGARKVKPGLLGQYITLQVARGELVSWTVALIGSSLKDAERGEFVGQSIGLIDRAPHPDKEAPDRENVYRIRRLVSPADEAIDLDDDQKKRALELTRRNWTPDPARPDRNERPKVAGGEEFRQVRDRTRGLLLIYPLNPKDWVKSARPVIGFALSFPGSSDPPTVKYRVNNTYWRLEYADA